MATSCTSDPVSAAGCAGLPAFLVPASFCAGSLAAGFLLLGLRSTLGSSVATVSADLLPLTLRCTFSLPVDSASEMRRYMLRSHTGRASLTSLHRGRLGQASRQCAPSFCRLPRTSPFAGAFDFRLIGSLVSSMLFWLRDLVATMMVRRYTTFGGRLYGVWLLKYEGALTPLQNDKACRACCVSCAKPAAEILKFDMALRTQKSATS